MENLSQYKILLVDDLQDNLFSLSAILKNAGYQSDSALSGKEALKLLLKNDYGLVILDVQMPEMNGLEVAELIKGNSKTKNIPLIFLSANAVQKEFFRKGHEVGALDYLTKPADESLLLLKVRNFLQLHHSTTQLDKVNYILGKKAVQAKKSYQDLYYSLPQTVFLINADGIIVNINRSGILSWGLHTKDMLYQHYSKSPFLIKIFRTSDNTNNFISFFEQQVTSKTVEFRVEKPDKTIFIGEAVIGLVMIEGGPHIQLSASDITEKKKTEEIVRLNFKEISNSEKINQAILRGDSINEISKLLLATFSEIAEINSSRLYLYDKKNNKLNIIGENIEENIILGLEQKLGVKLSSLVPPLNGGTLFKKVVEQKQSIITSDKSEIKKLLAEYTDSIILKKLAGWARDFINAKTGGVLPMISEGDLLGLITFSSPKIMQEEEKQAVLRFSNLAATVLAKKQNELALAQSEERFELAMQGANDGLWDWNLLTNEVYFSPRWKSMLGYNEDELVGNQNAWKNLLHKEDKEKTNNILQEFIEDKHSEYRAEYRMKHKKGHYVDVLARGRGVRDKNGKLYRMVGTHTDITKRKKSELKLLKTVNELNDRCNELMQFNYIVSHNLKAPIANILGLANVLNLPETKEAEKPKIFEFIKTAAIKIDTLVKDLGSILTNRVPLNAKKELVSIPNLIKSISNTLENQIFEAKGVITTDIAEEAKEVFTIRSYMESIFYNLISNAIKYKSKHRPLHVSISTKKVEGNLLILISDNGRGIDMSQHGENIFGLYKRFHLDIEGKGLGLHMTKTQVEALGGKITVESIHDEGTTFKIAIPL